MHIAMLVKSNGTIETESYKPDMTKANYTVYVR